MSPRNAGILFLVAAALGAFVYFYEIQGEEGRRQAEERQKQLFPDVESDAVDWVELTTTDGVQVRAEHAGGRWKIVKPLDFPGDDFSLDGVAGALAQLSSEAVYEKPEAPAVYGLDDAAGEVRFGAGGKQYAVRVGHKTPIGENTYASVVGREPVYAVPTFRANSLRKSFDDLRDKRVVRFDQAAVVGVVATWPDGRVELRRDGEDWKIVAPVQGRADAETVQGLLSNLSFLRANGFADQPPPDAEVGLTQPAFGVELALAPAEAGGEPRRIGVAIGSAVEGKERFARSDQHSLYKIPAERLNDFPRSLGRYRFKELADFPAAEAKRIALAFHPAQGEAVEVTATLEDGDWKSGPEAVDPEKLRRLVEELAKLHAADVVAESAGADELRGLGLDPPRVSLRVYGEDPKAEPLADVRIGVQRRSGGFVAQHGGDPMLYELDGKDAEFLPVSLEALRSRFLVKAAAAKPQAPAETPAPQQPPAGEAGEAP